MGTLEVHSPPPRLAPDISAPWWWKIDQRVGQVAMPWVDASPRPIETQGYLSCAETDRLGAGRRGSGFDVPVVMHPLLVAII